MLYPKDGDQVYPPVVGVGSLAAQSPVGLGVINDPSGIAVSYDTAGLYTRITTANPAVVSRLPDLGAYFSTPLLDVFGQAFTLELGDAIQVMLWADAPVPNPDTVIWACCSVGALSATSFGFGVMLEAVAGVWRAQHCIGNGTLWTVSNAGATSASTRGAIAQVTVGADDSQARVNAFPVDAAGLKVTPTNAPTSPSTVGSWVDTIDTLSWGTGWATGVGGAGGVASFSPRVIAAKRATIANTVL